LAIETRRDRFRTKPRDLSPQTLARTLAAALTKNSALQTEYLAARKHLGERRVAAWELGQMFDRLQDRQGAAQWFDIWLLSDAVWGEATLLSVIALPMWYQSERAERPSNETDLGRLVPADPDSYLNSVRNRWLSQNEKEIVALMRSFGLPEEAAKHMLKIGIDSIPPSWWEQEVRPKLTEDQWTALRAKLDERKSL
jgi:hypothetical protein